MAFRYCFTLCVLRAVLAEKLDGNNLQSPAAVGNYSLAAARSLQAFANYWEDCSFAGATNSNLGQQCSPFPDDSGGCATYCAAGGWTVTGAGSGQSCDNNGCVDTYTPARFQFTAQAKDVSCGLLCKIHCDCGYADLALSSYEGEVAAAGTLHVGSNTHPNWGSVTIFKPTILANFIAVKLGAIDCAMLFRFDLLQPSGTKCFQFPTPTPTPSTTPSRTPSTTPSPSNTPASSTSPSRSSTSTPSRTPSCTPSTGATPTTTPSPTSTTTADATRIVTFSMSINHIQDSGWAESFITNINTFTSVVAAQAGVNSGMGMVEVKRVSIVSSNTDVYRNPRFYSSSIRRQLGSSARSLATVDLQFDIVITTSSSNAALVISSTIHQYSDFGQRVVDGIIAAAPSFAAGASLGSITAPVTAASPSSSPSPASLSRSSTGYLASFIGSAIVLPLLGGVTIIVCAFMCYRKGCCKPAATEDADGQETHLAPVVLGGPLPTPTGTNGVPTLAAPSTERASFSQFNPIMVGQQHVRPSPGMAFMHPMMGSTGKAVVKQSIMTIISAPPPHPPQPYMIADRRSVGEPAMVHTQYDVVLMPQGPAVYMQSPAAADGGYGRAHADDLRGYSLCSQQQLHWG